MTLLDALIDGFRSYVLDGGGWPPELRRDTIIAPLDSLLVRWDDTAAVVNAGVDSLYWLAAFELAGAATLRSPWRIKDARHLPSSFRLPS